MTNEVKPSEQQVPPRRKILRGSLSAPLVLTVASPSVLGQAVTSFQECIARAATQPQPSIAFADGPDGWFRVPVEIYTGNVPQSNPTGNQQYFKFEGKFYQVAPGTCPAPAYDSINGQSSLIATKYALVSVNTNGDIVGRGTCKNGGFAVSTSCWTSFVTRGA